MAKSKLTLEIEEALKTYEANANMARGRNLAFEVPVVCGTANGGLIDAVEVVEVTLYTHRTLGCRWCTSKGLTMSQFSMAKCPRGYEKAKRDCDDEECGWCFNRRKTKDELYIYCYEIKSTRADFMSKNGHNFVGNYNYYVMPLELYSQVQDLVPADIGVIAYMSRTKSDINHKLRKKKDAGYRDIGIEKQAWLMLSTFKRMKRSGEMYDFRKPGMQYNYDTGKYEEIHYF